jgi:hypothetical protein
MTFRTGSITSATPAKAMLDLLDTDLAAVGYVRAETALVVGAVTWNVYRSPGTANFFGSDWFFALGYDTTAQTALYSCVFEAWDGTGKLADRFAPSTTGLVPAAGYVNPEAAAALPAGCTLSHLLPTTAFTYAYSALIDRVAIGAWTAATYGRFGWYIGLYDSFYSTADDPFPLVICSIGGAQFIPSSLYGSASREPMTTSASSVNFRVHQGVAKSSGAYTEHLWNVSAAANSYQGGRPWVSRVRLFGRGGQFAFPRGLFRDLWAGPNETGYVSNGDRITWSSGGSAYAGVIYRATQGSSSTPPYPVPILIPEY